MLQTAAVHPATLALLRKVMQMPELRQFNLVGGTALALQLGHRVSIDLLPLLARTPQVYGKREVTNLAVKNWDMAVKIKAEELLELIPEESPFAVVGVPPTTSGGVSDRT